MKKETSENGLDALRNTAIQNLKTFYDSFELYLDAYDRSQIFNNNSCGDERYLIIKEVFDTFEKEKNLIFPEEINKIEMAYELFEYGNLLSFVTNVSKVSKMVSKNKIHLGESLGKKMQTIIAYLIYKSDNNDKYKTISEIASSYFDPDEKRKQTNLDKKKTKRSQEKLNKKDEPKP